MIQCIIQNTAQHIFRENILDSVFLEAVKMNIQIYYEKVMQTFLVLLVCKTISTFLFSKCINHKSTIMKINSAETKRQKKNRFSCSRLHVVLVMWLTVDNTIGMN